MTKETYHLPEQFTKIEIGDTVEYLKRVPIKTKERYDDIPIYGIWDGEKVQFNDNEKVVVRTTRFLKKCNFF
jgi:hypothetical protein